MISARGRDAKPRCGKRRLRWGSVAEVSFGTADNATQTPPTGSIAASRLNHSQRLISAYSCPSIEK